MPIRTSSVLFWGSRVPQETQDAVRDLMYHHTSGPTMLHLAFQCFLYDVEAMCFGIHLGDAFPSVVQPLGAEILSSPHVQVDIPLDHAECRYRQATLLAEKCGISLPVPSLLALDMVYIEIVMGEGEPLPSDLTNIPFARHLSDGDGLTFYACYVLPEDVMGALEDLRQASAAQVIRGFHINGEVEI